MRTSVSAGVVGSRSVWAAFLLVVVSGAVGCEAIVRASVIDAPNRGQSFDGEVNVLKPGPALWGIDHELHVEVGPPEATLRVWIKEPTGLEESESEPRGTVLVLHGWRAESFWMRHMGKTFAGEGYRAVHVDLRGHGGSTGDAITFGALESRDLVQVLDALEEVGVLTGPVGVWGTSMGAATAIQFAARERRVEAVVAVAPYTSMREIAPLTSRRVMPLLHLADDAAYERVIDEAGEKYQFDPDEADTVAAIRKVEAPVLIVHGKGDFIVPVDHGRKLKAAGGENCELIELAWTGHFAAHFSGAMSSESVAFFNRTLGGD